MLRFPLNKKLLLITTAGTISCEIIRATKEFLFCKNTKFEELEIGKVYIDRNAVVAYTDIFEEKNNLKEKISQAKIINFNDYFLNKGK